MAWMFTVPLLVRARGPRDCGRDGTAAVAERTVLGWSGMRGGVSLAAALALPLTAAGRRVPRPRGRDLHRYIAIAATLVIPGLTLSPLVRRLGLGEEEAVAREEARARVQLAHAALRRHRGSGRTRATRRTASLDQLRMTYELRIHRLEPDADGNPARGDEAAAARRIRELRRELIGVERRRLAYLRRRGEISAQTLRQIEHELDLEESRLAQ